VDTVDILISGSIIVITVDVINVFNFFFILATFCNVLNVCSKYFFGFLMFCYIYGSSRP